MDRWKKSSDVGKNEIDIHQISTHQTPPSCSSTILVPIIHHCNMSEDAVLGILREDGKRSNIIVYIGNPRNASSETEQKSPLQSESSSRYHRTQPKKLSEKKIIYTVARGRGSSTRRGSECTEPSPHGRLVLSLSPDTGLRLLPLKILDRLGLSGRC